MNIWDFVTGGIVAVIFILAVRNLIKNRKSGKCSCGCGGCTKKCSK